LKRKRDMFGKNNPFYGKHHSLKTRKEISLRQIGKKLSSETKKKISENLVKQHSLGLRKNVWQKVVATRRKNNSYHFSDDSLKKMKDNHWSKNLAIRDEVISKIKNNQNTHLISLKMMGNKNPMKRPEVRAKMSESSKGKVVSSETKKKISEHSTILWKDPEYIQKVTIARNKGLNIKPNKIERKLITICDKYNLGFKFVGDGSFLIGKYNPDFIDEDNNLIIEVNGTYWHNLPEVKKKDIKKLFNYYDKGYIILDIWEHELTKVKGKDPPLTEEQIVSKIINFKNKFKEQYS
jgi:very-short-patch-repair endonuclease